MNVEQNVVGGFKSWLLHLKFPEFESGFLQNDMKIVSEGRHFGWLVPFVFSDCNDKRKIALLTNWRNENRLSFLNSREVDINSSKVWMEREVIKNELRELFWIVDSEREYIGHIGIIFDRDKSWFELDSILRGERRTPGIMHFSIKCLEKILAKDLKISELYLRVVNDNQRAIKFYENLGYKIENNALLSKGSANGTLNNRIKIMSKKIGAINFK